MDEVTTEDLKHILIEALCEEEPQDLGLLEDMVGYNKDLISNGLRELEEEKIVSSKYEISGFTKGGTPVGRALYRLTPLWRDVYSSLFKIEK